MSKFNQNEVRSTVAAALLTIVFSTALVLGAVGPARATTPSHFGETAATISVERPLA